MGEDGEIKTRVERKRNKRKKKKRVAQEDKESSCGADQRKRRCRNPSAGPAKRGCPSRTIPPSLRRSIALSGFGTQPESPYSARPLRFGSGSLRAAPNQTSGLRNFSSAPCG